MAIELPYDLLPELAPLAWVIGSWEGQGRLGAGEDDSEIFYQRLDFAETGLPFLQYRAETWLSEEDGTLIRPLTFESGYWALDRQRHSSDVGPGMKPAEIIPAYRSAEDVERLRKNDADFPITATITHPGSMSELYYGIVRGPQIQLNADAVMLGTLSGNYHSANRIYGLVNGQMFWRWDVIEAKGEQPQPHASGILDKMPSENDGRLPPGKPDLPGKHET